jgi:hypothetical protein
MALTTEYRNRIVDSITGWSSLLYGNPDSTGQQTLPEVDMTIGLAYVADSTKTPEEAGYFAEPSGNGYARKRIGNNRQSTSRLFNKAANGEAANSEGIFFSEATGPWAGGQPLTHFLIFCTTGTGSSAKTVMVAYAPLRDDKGATSSVTVNQNNTVVLFRAGQLVIKYTDVT